MEDYDIVKKAAHDLTVMLRAAKRQADMLRAMKVPEQERKKLIEAMNQAEEQFKLFKI